MTLLGFLYTVGGPPWPTSPVFSPQGASASSPFDVPFLVRNDSQIFPITGLSLRCVLVKVTTERRHSFTQAIMSTGNANEVIAPQSARSYICPFYRFVRADLKITSAQIMLGYRYDSRWPWGGVVEGHSEVFTLYPGAAGQWMPGVPLR